MSFKNSMLNITFGCWRAFRLPCACKFSRGWYATYGFPNLLNHVNLFHGKSYRIFGLQNILRKMLNKVMLGLRDRITWGKFKRKNCLKLRLYQELVLSTKTFTFKLLFWIVGFTLNIIIPSHSDSIFFNINYNIIIS